MRLTAEALSDQELREIHQATLQVLERIGVVFHHTQSCDLLASRGARVEGNLVKIPPELLAEALQTVPRSFTLAARNPRHAVAIGGDFPPVLGPAAGAVFVQDIVRGRRPGVFSDLKNLLALSQSSCCVGVSVAGILTPADLPEKGCYLRMLEQAIRLSDKPLVGLSLGGQMSRESIELARIATGGQGDHFVIGIVNSLSPLAWDERMLEAVWAFAGNRQPLVLACCSMAGFTSPTTLAMTLVQNNAELLAGIVLTQLIQPGTPVVYGNTSTVTDMLTMNLCIGAPEFALISLAAAQLAEFYGIPYRSGGGLSDAKTVDAQAGLESATNLFATLASRVHFVLHALGIMESFLSISYEKWMMDEEIVGRMQRLSRGVGPLPTDACQLIGEGAAGGQFLDSRDTLDNFRSVFYRPTLSHRGNWDGWLKRERDYNQMAYDACRERLARFQPPEMAADTDTALKQYLSAQ